MARWARSAKRAGRLTRSEVIELAREVQAWRSHPDGHDACPGPIRRRGLRARNRLTTGNMMLVVGLAHKNLGRIAGSGGLELADLLQAGALGLSRAAEKYDPEKGFEFSTYAYWWIRQAIGDEIERRSETIKIPAPVRYALMDGKPRKNATAEQITAARTVQAVRSLEYSHPGVDPDGGLTVADTVADPRSDPMERMEDAERQERIESLGGDDLALLRLRFEDRASLNDLSSLMHTRPQAVKEAINAAGHRLREVLAAA